MKNKALTSFHKGLIDSGKLQGVKFAYAVSKNKKKIEAEVEVLNEGLKPSEKFEEYNKKRIELGESLSEKDEKGKLKTKKDESGQEIFDFKDSKKFYKDLKKLQEEYKEVMDSRKKQLDEYNALMEEECKIEMHKVKLENVPEEITGEQMETISEMIEE